LAFEEASDCVASGLPAGESAGGLACDPVASGAFDAGGAALAGGGAGGGGLGWLRSCLTAEGAEGSSSEEFWASSTVTNHMLPSNNMTPRNFMTPQL
jgi:hypothetical protein